MTNLLVTGGAGFIGSNLTERLVREGFAVRVLDNLSNGKWRNLERVLRDIEFIRGDLRDLDTVRKAVTGVEVVFHQAALSSVPPSIEDPLITNEVNVTGTLNVLVASRDAGVRRVVYASSASAYGDAPELPSCEQAPPLPLSPYATSKLAGEFWLRAFYETYGLEGLSLRYFNVFGPRQDPSSPYAGVIPRFILALSRGEPPIIFGDGQQSRDFLFVDDAVDATILAATCPNASGDVVNVASGQGYTLNDLVRRLQTVMGRAIRPLYMNPRVGDVRHSRADLARAREILGFQPRIDFNDGLRRTVEWLLRYESEKR